MDEQRLEELLDGHFSGRLSEFERAELMTLLEEHPAARERLASEALFETHLGIELSRDLPEVPPLQEEAPRFKRTRNPESLNPLD